MKMYLPFSSELTRYSLRKSARFEFRKLRNAAGRKSGARQPAQTCAPGRKWAHPRLAGAPVADPHEDAPRGLFRRALVKFAGRDADTCGDSGPFVTAGSRLPPRPTRRHAAAPGPPLCLGSRDSALTAGCGRTRAHFGNTPTSVHDVAVCRIFRTCWRTASASAFSCTGPSSLSDPTGRFMPSTLAARW